MITVQLKMGKRPGGCLIFNSADSREKAIDMLRNQGFNYFVPFKDVNGNGLQFGNASWVKPGSVHINRN